MQISSVGALNSRLIFTEYIHGTDTKAQIVAILTWVRLPPKFERMDVGGVEGKTEGR